MTNPGEAILFEQHLFCFNRSVEEAPTLKKGRILQTGFSDLFNKTECYLPCDIRRWPSVKVKGFIDTSKPSEVCC